METVAAHNRAIARAPGAIVEIDVAIENESVLIGRVAAPGIICACPHPEQQGHAPCGRIVVKYFQLELFVDAKQWLAGNTACAAARSWASSRWAFRLHDNPRQSFANSTLLRLLGTSRNVARSLVANPEAVRP